jgi:hypothetical protein
MVLLKSLQQHLLRVLVGDVADHDGRPPVSLDRPDVDDIGLRLLVANGPTVANCRGFHHVVVVVAVHGHHHRHAGVGIGRRGIGGHVGHIGQGR